MAGRRLRGIIPPVTGLGQGIGNSSASFHVVCLHLKPSSMELTRSLVQNPPVFQGGIS